MNQPLLALSFSFASSLSLSAFTELKNIKILLSVRLWLKEMWLVWSSIQATKTFSISAMSVSLSYNSYVHWSSASNFLQELFLCIHNLANWYKNPDFQPVLAFDMLSSLSLIISSFWFKVKDTQLFLSHEHLKTVSRFNWPHFKFGVELTYSVVLVSVA